MIKLVVRSFLWLCLLLVGAHGSLPAHLSGDTAPYSSSDALSGGLSTHSHHLSDCHGAFVHRSTSSGDATHNLLVSPTIGEEEVEVDKRSSFKRNLAGSTYYAAIFYALSIGYGYPHLNDRLFFYKQFLSYPSYPLYLIFRVFRI